MERKTIVELSRYQNPLCVSLIARTHRRPPENQQDPLVVKNLVSELQTRLLAEHSARNIDPVMSRIQDMVSKIDWAHTQDGICLFASNEFAMAQSVPYPVRSRVVIDETFATRDLLFTLNRSPHYRVLVLSEKPTRLFEAFRDELVEVENTLFPVSHEGLGAAEVLPRDPGVNFSAYRNEKHRQFFREIDRRLSEVEGGQSLPLVVLGMDRYVAFFRETSQHMRNIVGTREGAYDWQTSSEISKVAWPLMQSYLESKSLEALATLDAAVSRNRYASAIDKVWRFAKEGRVDSLIVEENFHFSGGEDDQGFLVSEGGRRWMDDAVDELVEAVIQRGGRVVFVPDQTLAHHQHIAATLRY